MSRFDAVDGEIVALLFDWIDSFGAGSVDFELGGEMSDDEERAICDAIERRGADREEPLKILMPLVKQ